MDLCFGSSCGPGSPILDYHSYGQNPKVDLFFGCSCGSRASMVSEFGIRYKPSIAPIQTTHETEAHTSDPSKKKLRCVPFGELYAFLAAMKKLNLFRWWAENGDTGIAHFGGSNDQMNISIEHMVYDSIAYSM